MYASLRVHVFLPRSATQGDGPLAALAVGTHQLRQGEGEFSDVVVFIQTTGVHLAVLVVDLDGDLQG